MKKHYEALDGLRGVAALAVAGLHICAICHLPVSPANAHLAVDFFFCLSGFVIAHAYERRLTTTMNFAEFARERLIRLMPLAAAGAILGGLVLLARAATVHDVPLANALVATGLNALALPSLGLVSIHPDAFGADGPLWSLFWELAINAAFAIVAMRLTTPGMVALVVAGAGLTAWSAFAHRGLDIGFSTNDLFTLGPARVFYPFACGVLLRRLPLVSNSLALLAAAALCLLLFGPRADWIGEAAAVLLAFPALTWICAGSNVGPKTRSACLWLGRVSYPMYVLNHPIARLSAKLGQKLHVSDVATAGLCAVVVLAASVAAVPIDERARAWLKARTARPAATIARAA